MRKQFKIAAIVSAAALLAIGASMTSFAVTGWQEEDGSWVYYNRSGEQVSDEWEKSGSNWFYLDDDGTMATDKLIEYNDNYYYVDVNGAMVTNQWVAIDNEDAGEEDQPDVWWYYFQGNGKAYKNNHSSGNIFKKAINGKTYCFDEDGKMQYGWVSHDDGTTNYDDDAYAQCEYYFGDENDGAMTVGWREIALTDVTDAEDDQPGDSFWDEDQVRWFWFKSSGKKQTSKTNKAINGRKYGFDDTGRMIADWYSASYNDGYSTASRRGTTNNAVAGDIIDNARTFMYFSSPEDGARYTKGWFKVVPGYYLNYGDYDDSNNRWFYADGQGKIYAGQIKSIKGKKYAFDLKGGMISGLAILRVDQSNTIYEYLADDGAFPYDTEDNFDETVASIVTEDYGSDGTMYAVYYFSDDADHDGTMKTGTQRVVIDGDTLTFKFKKSGTKKGQGVTGYSDKKYYLGGKLLKADSDNKIEVIGIGASNWLDKMTVSELIDDLGLVAITLDEDERAGKAREDDSVYVPAGGSIADWDITALTKDQYAVVNTSGSVVKSGTKKDGEGIKVVLSNKAIQEIYAED
jgi:glucan-binding YG repeat protein